MVLYRFRDVTQLTEKMGDAFVSKEVEECLLLGILGSLTRSIPSSLKPSSSAPVSPPQSAEPYLALVPTVDQFPLVAVQSAPFPLVISSTQDRDALSLLAQDLQNATTPTGVISDPNTATQFAQIWQTLTGSGHQVKMQMRIHKLTQVTNLPRPTGYLDPANLADFPLLLDWYGQFVQEVFGTPARLLETTVQSAFDRRAMYLWRDGEPVSLVMVGGSTPHGQRIGPVYTPPLWRGRGYASAAVAELSRWQLRQGAQFCCLFTDLANPTSNHIYAQIGYRPVADSLELAFIDHPTD